MVAVRTGERGAEIEVREGDDSSAGSLHGHGPITLPMTTLARSPATRTTRIVPANFDSHRGVRTSRLRQRKDQTSTPGREFPRLRSSERSLLSDPAFPLRQGVRFGGAVGADGDERYLLQVRVVPLFVGFTVARGKLRQRGLRRQ